MQILGGWVLLLPLLLVTDSKFAFAGGGDDEDYYYLIRYIANSWHELFDLSRFSGSTEQPGYPFVLSIAFQFSDDSLLQLKAVNLAVLLSLIPIWYRIGLELETKEFARRLGIAIIFLTPLWYYGFFLLKDVFIAFLQSLFLMGLVQISKHRSFMPWILIGVASLVTILFRAPLVLVNLTVVVGVMMISLTKQGKWYQKASVTIIGAALVIGIISLASNPEWMASIGIKTEHRVIGSIEMQETIERASKESLMNRILFPLLYLFIETSGLNPNSWLNFDAFTLRGVLAVPWIFIGVPFFLFGLQWLFRFDSRSTSAHGVLPRLGKLRVINSAWSGIVLFIIVYLLLSWKVGDTTRWRVSDMPAMAAVAVAGWMYGAPRIRYPILMTWVYGLGLLFVVFYAVRGI